MSKYLSGVFLGGVAAATVGATAALSQPIYKSWEAASEFSDTSNVSDNGAGPFSYGYETPVLNVGFALMTTSYNFDGLAGWTADLSDTDTPNILHTPSNFTTHPANGPAFPPHAMSLHPGPNCEYADLRFTAPRKGKYAISGQFYMIEFGGGGATTDVHISRNGVAIYDGQISGSLISASFSELKVGLKAGGVIDFQVGCGANGNYFGDTTGLNAVIEQR